MDPSALRYAKSHEWVMLDQGVATVGISQFAVEQLTEPTFLELPKVGTVLKVGDEIGVIESVKSTSSIYAPVPGEVIEVNTLLLDDAATKRKADLLLVNDDPFGKGWMVKIRLADGATLDHLMTYDQYEAQLHSEGH